MLRYKLLVSSAFLILISIFGRETPVNLNKKQIEILKSFQETSDKNESPLSSAFFKKAREFWKRKA